MNGIDAKSLIRIRQIKFLAKYNDEKWTFEKINTSSFIKKYTIEQFPFSKNYSPSQILSKYCIFKANKSPLLQYFACLINQKTSTSGFKKINGYFNDDYVLVNGNSLVNIYTNEIKKLDELSHNTSTLISTQSGALYTITRGDNKINKIFMNADGKIVKISFTVPGNLTVGFIKCVTADKLVIVCNGSKSTNHHYVLVDFEDEWKILYLMLSGKI